MQRRRRNLGGTVPENPGIKVDVTMAYIIFKKKKLKWAQIEPQKKNCMCMISHQHYTEGQKI